VTEHIGENAELYPLGLLDDEASRSLELHIAECSSCAERVSQAQGAAAILATTLPAAQPSMALERRLRAAMQPQALRGRRRPNFARLAFAAALVLAFLALGWQTLVLRGRLASQDLALVTLVHSHFNHASTVPESNNPVTAKVLFARDGSWIYIIADKPSGTLHAIGRTKAGTSDLGALSNNGNTATLLVRPTQRIQSIVLRRDNVDVASATLVY